MGVTTKVLVCYYCLFNVVQLGYILSFSLFNARGAVEMGQDFTTKMLVTRDVERFTLLLKSDAAVEQTRPVALLLLLSSTYCELT